MSVSYVARDNAAAPVGPVHGFFARPCCPGCGVEALAPERSVFVGDGQVRHLWTCDECGEAFVSTAAFGAFRG